MKQKMEKAILFVIGILVGVLLLLIVGLTNKGSLSTGNTILNTQSNWLTEDDIQLKDNQLIININNSQILTYSDTRSMQPYVNQNSMSIILKPEYGSLKVGDVIIFQKNGKLITHRIVGLGTDNSGVFYLTQGDNNEVSDGKIRFEDIKGVVVGVLY